MSLKAKAERNLRHMLRGFVLALLLCCAVFRISAGHSTSAQNSQPDWAAEGRAWWAHVQYLASDEMRGRETGTDDYRKAADYVSQKFADAGLQPAGTRGFLQEVDFDVRQIDEAHSSLALVHEGKTEELKLGEDATLRVSGEPAESVRAAAVFVGYGFAVPEMNYDDFVGQDLHGKIAVYLSGGSSTIPGPLKAHYQSTGERWAALRRAGAIGVATIGNPKNSDIPWERAALARTQPSMSLTDPNLVETHGMQFAASINPAQADKWFAGTGHTIAELLSTADADHPLPHFPLKVAVQARIGVIRHKVSAPNVIGVLPGSDPKLKSEYVAISAHLDHVGVGMPINGDSIYNGAMDNASGVASVIEIARHFKSDGLRPKRSVLFIALTAEEKGDLGSEYFVAHPTVDRNQIVADINMDMFLPLFALRYLEVQGLDESTLGDDIRAVCESQGVIVQADKEPNRNRFIRSDQYSFVKAGIPALAFKFGWVKGTPEEKTFQDWVRTRYHAPSDDLDQPVDAAAAAQFNHILVLLATRVANAEGRPTWKPDSFFRRFAKSD